MRYLRRLDERSTRALLIALAVSLALLGAPAVAASASSGTVDDPVRLGDAVVIDAEEPTVELASGDNATAFSLRLPAGATCPGDSANDQWRTQSFIVPADVDVSTLTFGVNDPDGEGNWSLYGVTSRPYVNEALPQNPEPGLPALVPAVPPLTFVEFPSGLLPDGRYRIGIACSYFREIAQWWDAEIEVSADPGDDSGRWSWNVVDASTTAVGAAGEGDGGDGSRSLVTVIAIVAGALAAAVIALVLFRRTPTNPASVSASPRRNSHVDR